MKKPTKADRIDEARLAHYRREIALFALKPWEMPPYMATASCARDGAGWAESYPLARSRRLQLLAEDVHHYDDIGG